jgi:hypothetical protein
VPSGKSSRNGPELGQLDPVYLAELDPDAHAVPHIGGLDPGEVAD